MADRSNKVEGNVKGAYFVDDSCIGCGVCAETAPENFRMSGNFATVFKQPANGNEHRACEEAKDACPAEAIGNDGE